MIRAQHQTGVSVVGIQYWKLSGTALLSAMETENTALFYVLLKGSRGLLIR